MVVASGLIICAAGSYGVGAILTRALPGRHDPVGLHAGAKFATHCQVWFIQITYANDIAPTLNAI
ncbi:MAG: hypothetical protein Kow0074_12140 [Candidatus Zixiibacteriota bacterium]